MNFLYPLPFTNPLLEACVIVPAKDEAVHLPTTLQALADQRDLNGKPLARHRWEVLLLINNSTDDSFSVASRFQRAHPNFPLHIAECYLPAPSAHIGHVRKLLMDCACERLERQPKTSSLILSTDADTEVAPDWVIQNLVEVRQGAQAIGGRIRLQPEDLQSLEPHAKRIQFRDDQYHLLLSWLEDQCDPQDYDRWPRHHQHFGGSFAVTPSAYRQVGGLPPKRFLEDVALHEALIRQDIRFRHSPKVRVRTSGRLRGKTTIGLAEQLSRWSQGPAKIVVPSVMLWHTFFSLRRQFRRLWYKMSKSQSLCPSVLEKLPSLCGVGRTELLNLLENPWFGSAFEKLNLRERLEKELPTGTTRQTLDEAVSHLRTLFRGTGFTYSPRFVEAVQVGTAVLETK